MRLNLNGQHGRRCDIVGRGRVKHTEFAMASGELSRRDFVHFLKGTLAVAASSPRPTKWINMTRGVSCRRWL